MTEEQKLYYRNYYAANRERIRLQQNKRYNESADLKAKAAARFDKNREHRYAYMREYYRIHPELQVKIYARHKNWLKNNFDKFLEAKARFKTKAEALKNYLRDLKSKTPCMDCQKTYPYYVMDFDHRDPTLKIATVSYVARNTHNLNKVQLEMDKCDPVCANCHRIRTHLKKQSRNKKYVNKN